MATIGHCFVVVLLPLSVVYSTIELEDFAYHEYLALYTVTLLKYHASQQISTFDCWFYHATTSGHSHILEEIYLELDEKSTITRLTTNSNFNWLQLRQNMAKLPALVIVHLEYARYDRLVQENSDLLVTMLPSTTKFIFLMSTTERKAWAVFKTILVLLTKCKTHDVVFLSVDNEFLIYHDFAKDINYISKRFADPKSLAWDQSRNRKGSPLRYGLLEYEKWYRCNENDCFGYDATLVKEMARYLNTTVQRVDFVCPKMFDKGDGYVYNCVRSVTYMTSCNFDIFIESISRKHYERAYLQSPFPMEHICLAPKGRALNVVELFFKPFQAQLWIAFFLGTIVIKVVSMLIPNRFRNDVLLLPICGFERYSLNQAGRNEKLVIITLIVLFFFLSNAYETKIISLMTNKPRVGKIDTFKDILDTNTPVKADHQLALEFPMFRSLYQNGTQQDHIQLDGTSVYMAGGLFGRTVIQRKVNWDYESNQPRYKVLDERFAMVIAFYPLPLRSIFKRHFEYVQGALWEAGILSLWHARNMHHMALDMDWQISEQGVNPASNILNVLDLLPAWLIVWCGASISLVVFLVEIISKVKIF